MGRHLVLSAAQDGVTVVTEEIVVIMDVVGMVAVGQSSESGLASPTDLPE